MIPLYSHLSPYQGARVSRRTLRSYHQLMVASISLLLLILGRRSLLSRSSSKFFRIRLFITFTGNSSQVILLHNSIVSQICMSPKYLCGSSGLSARVSIVFSPERIASRIY